MFKFSLITLHFIYRYFQHLFEDFEVQMKAYKVEIQNLESHIMSLHQPSRLTPEGKYSLLLDSINSFHFLIKENIF